MKTNCELKPFIEIVNFSYNDIVQTSEDLPFKPFGDDWEE